MNEILNKDFLGLEKLHEYLKNSYIVLECNSDMRITGLSFSQKEDMTEYLSGVKTRLISNPDVRTEKELITSWKEKGVDIEKMTEKFKTLERKYWKKMKELGKLISKDGRKDLIEELEVEILIIRDKQKVLSFKKTDALLTSFETQFISKMYRYASYLSLQKKIVESDLEGNEKSIRWIKAFTNYEEFLSDVKEEEANEALTLIALVDSHDRFNS